MSHLNGHISRLDDADVRAAVDTIRLEADDEIGLLRRWCAYDDETKKLAWLAVRQWLREDYGATTYGATQGNDAANWPRKFLKAACIAAESSVVRVRARERMTE